MLLEYTETVFYTVFSVLMSLPFVGLVIGYIYITLKLVEDPTWVASVNEMEIAEIAACLVLVYNLLLVLCFAVTNCCVNLKKSDRALTLVNTMTIVCVSAGIWFCRSFELGVLIVLFSSIFNLYVIFLGLMFAPITVHNDLFECDTPAFELSSLDKEKKDLIKI